LQNIAVAPRLALGPYSHLRTVVSSLKHAQSTADDSGSLLVGYTEKLTLSLREQIRNDFRKRMQQTLDEMRWPGKDLVLTDNLMQDWAESVELLLSLQEPYV
jgi:RAD50-interacting protein 1